MLGSSGKYNVGVDFILFVSYTTSTVGRDGKQHDDVMNANFNPISFILNC